MIYTITTNPSLDYTIDSDLIPGCINRARSEVIYPGGKGINVSIMLHRLGMPTKALGFAAGRVGQTIRELLDDLGCPHELLEISGGGQSRINVKFLGDVETAVNGRGPILSPEDLDRLLEKVWNVGPEDCLVVSGWTKTPDFYERLLSRANDCGCTTVLDCAGETLWRCLRFHPFLIKPNIQELGAIFGLEDLELGEAVALAGQLQNQGACNVMVSMGGNGSFLLTESHELFFASVCHGDKNNTVGAGDSQIAGFLTGLRHTKDYESALRLGVAAGCATAYSPWLGSKEDTMALYDQIRVEKMFF